MSEVLRNGVGNRLVWSLAVISLAAVCLWFGADLNTASAQVKSKTLKTVKNRAVGVGISGTGTGAIPDGGPGCGPLGTPLDISFDASGVSGTLTNVSVDMTASHSWVGDVNASLIAPDATEHVLFASTGSTSAAGCGSSSDLGALYTFDNSGTDDWWAQANPFPAGTYQTTVAGDQASPPAGDATDMNAAFAAANPTGTWTLRIVDGGGGDTGGVTAANLFLTTGAPPAANPNVDFDGDGTTDYSQVRDESITLAGSNSTRRAGSVRDRMKEMADRLTSGENAVLGPQVPGTSQVWYVNSSMSGTDSVVGFGESISDFVVPADYDGDGKADIAVWRPVAASGPNGAFFFVLNSSTSVVDTIDFGQNGDNPTVTGDYDGDGKADPAVFRCPSVAGQCNYFYKGSLGGGGFTTVAWGAGTPTDVFPSPGDFDGDGKYDFNIQREDPSTTGQGQFVLLRSSDGGVEFHNWGLNTDLIIPGDFDGDGQADITVGRAEGGLRVWYTFFRAGGFNIAQFGLSTDVMTPGDYDGDGKTDIAVYRPDPVPANNIFYVYRSSDAMVSGYDYGINFDYPLANWQVN